MGDLFSQTLSVEVGGGYVSQQGHFEAPCGCTFAQGNGFEAHLNSGIKLFSISDLSFGVGPGIEYQRFVDIEVNKDATKPILNGDRQISKLLYISVNPYIYYSWSTINLFLQVSPKIGYLVSKKFEHLSSSTSDEPEGNNSYEMDINHLRASLFAAVGYNIDMGKYRIIPSVGYELPFSRLRNELSDQNWKASSIRGSVLVMAPL